MNLFKKIHYSKKGATAIEYALIAALVAIAAITAMKTIGTSITSKMNIISSKLDEAKVADPPA